MLVSKATLNFFYALHIICLSLVSLNLPYKRLTFTPSLGLVRNIYHSNLNSERPTQNI